MSSAYQKITQSIAEDIYNKRNPAVAVIASNERPDESLLIAQSQAQVLYAFKKSDQLSRTLELFNHPRTILSEFKTNGFKGVFKHLVAPVTSIIVEHSFLPRADKTIIKRKINEIVSNISFKVKNTSTSSNSSDNIDQLLMVA